VEGSWDILGFEIEPPGPRTDFVRDLDDFFFCGLGFPMAGLF
jgi:hypothetical protein